MKMTNKEYSQQKEFKEFCRKANVKPTTRQASKHRRGIGAVYKRTILNIPVHVPNCAKIDIKAS